MLAGMTETAAVAPLVLVPGHWLGAWAWERVRTELARMHVPAHPVTLPGLDPDDPDRASATIEDQAEALATLVGAVRTGDRRPVLVVHSGANAPASLLLDRDPGSVERIVYVDSGPVADGAVGDPEAPADLRELPLPHFDELQASLDGLDEAALEEFRRRAVPEPGPVVVRPLRLEDPRRREVPATLICCSFSSQVLMEMARSGEEMMAETATLTDLTLLDLPTGHWPMWSRPVDLAEMLAAIARG